MSYEISDEKYEEMMDKIRSIETLPERIPSNAYRGMALMMLAGVLAVTDQKEVGPVKMGPVEPVYKDGRVTGMQYKATAPDGQALVLYNESAPWVGKWSTETQGITKAWQPGETHQLTTTRWTKPNILEIK